MKRPLTLALAFAALAVLPGRAGLQVDGADGRTHTATARRMTRRSRSCGSASSLRGPAEVAPGRRCSSARRPSTPRSPGQLRHDVLRAWCPHCKRAKAYFARKGVGYREVDIEASDADRREFEEYGGKGVPLIIVGERRMRGFDPDAMDRLLASARP